MFLLVPAHPGFPGQIPQSRKTVVCVCVFLYSFHASVKFSLPISIVLYSFPLLLQQPPHSTTMFPYLCMDLVTIHILCCFRHYIFICCQCLFTSRYFHCATSTVLLYSSHLFLLETCTLGLNFLCHLFVILSCMSITNNLCFGTHSSFGMTLILRTLALSPCRTIIVNHTLNRTSYVCHQLGFLLHGHCVADD